MATWAAGLYLALLVGLLACAVLPLLAGWRGNLIVSDSMAPTLPAGSVLMTSPPERGTQPRTGAVVVVSDAGAAGGALAHRIVGREHGRLILQGDANPTPDMHRVAAADVRGVARLAVPYVGKPAVWARDRTVLPLAVWVVLTAGAIVVVTGRRARPRPLEIRPVAQAG
ncbi:MAG: S26 family signal peptidase [Solirubrobacteraceae bacterium]|nr:S26 family signal peptidase [Solirubrobacteraceae bacterium]